MDKIPPLAWAALGAIMLVAVVVNSWMIYLFRKSRRKDSSAASPFYRRRRAGGFDAQRFIETVRDPFKQENEQINELSEQVKKIKK